MNIPRPITLRQISPLTGKMEELEILLTSAEIKRLVHWYWFGGNFRQLFANRLPEVEQFFFLTNSFREVRDRTPG